MTEIASYSSYRYRLQTFGGWRVLALDDSGRVWERIHTRKTCSLLALLAVWPRAWRREEICLQLWPDAPSDAARNSLSASLSALRRELGEDAFSADRYSVALNNALWSCDWAELEAALKVARDPSPAGAAALDKALALAPGPFLPELDEELLLGRARYVEETLCELLKCHLDALVNAAYEDKNAATSLLKLAGCALQRFPEEWGWNFYIMRAQERLGDCESALRTYEKLQACARKAGELTPEPARVLAREIRKQQSLIPVSYKANVAAPPPVEVAEAEPEEPAEASAPPHKKELVGPVLPPMWTKFFGRQPQIEAVVGLLQHGEKLVTLSGAGGTGKTRLSLEVARQLVEHFHSRVFFIPLASLFDPTLLLMTVRDGLGIPTGSDLPPKQQIAAALGDESALIVLDNFEQLFGEGTSYLQELREAVPNVQFLVTSRVLLGLPGECGYEVPPLSADAARALFLDRAAGRWNGAEHSQTIQDLCWRLEDLPLAIELAAARAALLSPAQIVERLDQKFDFLSQRGHGVATRHRTLRATIEWSFDLLDAEVRRFFLQLSIFRDGWPLGAACAVAEVEEWQSLDFLAQLREHSLISCAEEKSQPRFRMLVMLREWAQEQLSSAEMEALRARHYDYFLRLIEDHQFPLSLALNVAMLSCEMANFRAAIRFALERTDENAAAAAARLCVALFPLWEITSQYLVGREWIERTLAKMEEAGQAPVEAGLKGRLLCQAGMTLWYCGEYQAAYKLLEKGLALAREVGDEHTQAFAFAGLSRVTMTLGHIEMSLETATKSLEIARRLNDPIRLIDALLCQGWAFNNNERHHEGLGAGVECYLIAQATGIVPLMAVARALEAYCLTCAGELQSGFKILRSGVRLAYESENDWACSLCNAMFGVVAREAGDAQLARFLCTSAARSFARIGTRWEISSSLTDCATLACDAGQYERAARLFGAAQKMADSIRYRLIPCLARFIPSRMQALKVALPTDVYEREWKRGGEMSLEEALHDVDALASPPPAGILAL